MAHGQGTASLGGKRVSPVQPDAPETTQPQVAPGSSVLLLRQTQVLSPTLHCIHHCIHYHQILGCFVWGNNDSPATRWTSGCSPQRWRSIEGL